MNQFKPKVLLLLFFCIYNLTIAQIQNQPETFSKINFTYQKKSNFILTDTGVYADTILIKKYFPEIVFPQEDKNQPLDKLTGFIPFSELNEQSKGKLIGILWHDNVLIEGVYEVKKNKVKLVKIYGLPDLANNYSSLFKKSGETYQIKHIFKYNKNNTKLFITINNLIFIKEDINKNVIEWKNKEQGIGLYKGNKNINKDYTSIFKFGLDLPKYVNPYSIFANSEYGVKNIDALDHHYRLLSVNYE